MPGFGTCVEACPFDVLSMGENGLPQLDTEKLCGCGVGTACPRNVIRIVAIEKKNIFPASKRQGCFGLEIGCIGSKRVKACQMRPLL